MRLVFFAQCFCQQLQYGETLETTAEHPFYVVTQNDWLPLAWGGRWIDAGELQIGDDILQADGTTGEVQSVRVVAVTQPMYNLTVDQAHTFFVGRGQWLVHNAGPCAWTSPGGLIYDVGSKEGNRVLHVFEHLAPNAAKANHTVFNVGSSDELLGLLDEAWLGKRVQDPNDATAWITDMGRAVGTQGETKIRIIIKKGTNNEIITAYPVK